MKTELGVVYVLRCPGPQAASPTRGRHTPQVLTAPESWQVQPTDCITSICNSITVQPICIYHLRFQVPLVRDYTGSLEVAEASGQNSTHATATGRRRWNGDNDTPRHARKFAQLDLVTDTGLGILRHSQFHCDPWRPISPEYSGPGLWARPRNLQPLSPSCFH